MEVLIKNKEPAEPQSSVAVHTYDGEKKKAKTKDEMDMYPSWWRCKYSFSGTGTDVQSLLKDVMHSGRYATIDPTYQW